MPITKEERSKKSKEAWARRKAKEAEVLRHREIMVCNLIGSLGDDGRYNLLYGLLHTHGLLDLNTNKIVLPVCDGGWVCEDFELSIEELIKCPLP